MQEQHEDTSLESPKHLPREEEEEKEEMYHSNISEGSTVHVSETDLGLVKLCLSISYPN